jgi:hypothetical protein
MGTTDVLSSIAHQLQIRHVMIIRYITGGMKWRVIVVHYTNVETREVDMEIVIIIGIAIVGTAIRIIIKKYHKE